MNEQAIAALQALKAEPGFQMRWQDAVQRVIDTLSAPPVVPEPPPPPPEEPPAEEEAPKAKAKGK